MLKAAFPEGIFHLVTARTQCRMFVLDLDVTVPCHPGDDCAYWLNGANGNWWQNRTYSLALSQDDLKRAKDSAGCVRDRVENAIRDMQRLPAKGIPLGVSLGPDGKPQTLVSHFGHHVKDETGVIASFRNEDDAELFRLVRTVIIPPKVSPTVTPTAKFVWQLAKQEAERLGCTCIGTQHLLLALVKCQASVVRPFLESHGVTLQSIRDMPGYSADGRPTDEPVSVEARL